MDQQWQGEFRELVLIETETPPLADAALMGNLHLLSLQSSAGRGSPNASSLSLNQIELRNPQYNTVSPDISSTSFHIPTHSILTP